MTEKEQKALENAYEVTQSTVRYKKQNDKVIKIGKQIMQCLGPDRRLFLDYERAVVLSQETYLVNIYRLGIQDGRKVPQ